MNSVPWVYVASLDKCVSFVSNIRNCQLLSSSYKIEDDLFSSTAVARLQAVTSSESLEWIENIRRTVHRILWTVIFNTPKLYATLLAVCNGYFTHFRNNFDRLRWSSWSWSIKCCIQFLHFLMKSRTVFMEHEISYALPQQLQQKHNVFLLLIDLMCIQLHQIFWLNHGLVVILLCTSATISTGTDGLDRDRSHAPVPPSFFKCFWLNHVQFL